MPRRSPPPPRPLPPTSARLESRPPPLTPPPPPTTPSSPQTTHAGLSQATRGGLGVVMLRDMAPEAPLPEGVALRSIRPPTAEDTGELPEAKPPKPFTWRYGDYFVAAPSA